jgi:hypothetical protein
LSLVLSFPYFLVFLFLVLSIIRYPSGLPMFS